MADDDFRAQVAQAAAAVDAAKAALENNRRQRALQDARIERALAGIDQAQAQIAAAQAGKEAVQADVSRTTRGTQPSGSAGLEPVRPLDSMWRRQWPMPSGSPRNSPVETRI